METLKKHPLLGAVALAFFFVLIFYGGILVWYYQVSRVEHGKIVTLHINITPEVKNEVIQTQNIKELLETLKEIQKYQSNNSERFLTVSNLNSFYSTLLAAIGAILIILGFFGWKKFDSMKELGEAIEDANRQVKTLMQNKKDSDWVQEKFNLENNLASFDIELNLEEQQIYKNMKKHLFDEHKDDAWREIFIAHKLVSSEGQTLKNFINAEKIYRFIQERNLLDDCELEYRLFHYQGALYWTKYEWLKTYPGNYEREDDCGKCRKCLENAKSNYEKACSVAERNYIDCSQSKSNLAVVLIELAKHLEKGSDNQKQHLTDAKKHLEEVKSKSTSMDFNYNWDLARVEYYMDRNFTPLVEKKLVEAAKMVKDLKNAGIFYSKLLAEYEDPIGGFPGEKGLLLKIRTELEQRLFTKF